MDPRRLPPLLLACANVAMACASTPPHAAPAPAVASGPSTASSGRADGGGGAADDAFQWAGAAPTIGLGKERDARFEAECGWLRSEVESLGASGKVAGKSEELVRLLSDAARSRGENGALCLSLFEAGVRAYRDASIRIEATMTLRQLAVEVRAAEPTCLASTPPVPASMTAFGEDGRYRSAPSDWDDPAWRCLGHQAEGPQRYRYRLAIDALKRQFAAIAERGDGGETLFVRGPIAGTEPPEVLARAAGAVAAKR